MVYRRGGQDMLTFPGALYRLPECIAKARRRGNGVGMTSMERQDGGNTASPGLLDGACCVEREGEERHNPHGGPWGCLQTKGLHKV
jgi:hypothetical protein